MTTQNQLDRFREAANRAAPPASTKYYTRRIKIMTKTYHAMSMPEIIAMQEENARLRAALAKAQRDTVLMDWLADMDNDIGQVLLPTASVRRNPGSMRDAIEDAMNGGAQ